MKDRLTKSEALTIICIADKNLSVGETASNLYVTYQCIANRLQCIYDKLGIRRNLQALTKWYFVEGGYAAAQQRIGGDSILSVLCNDLSIRKM